MAVSNTRGARRFGRVAVGGTLEGFAVEWDLRALKQQIALVDEVTRKFRGSAFTSALTAANDAMAIKIQEAMVDQLDRKVRETGRHQRRENGLRWTLQQDGLRAVTADRFIVGRESFLDKSPAEAYWRQIEYGNVSRYAESAVFTNFDGRFSGPWRPGGGGAPQPPGYKHAFMPQNVKGGLGANFEIGPFPAYRFAQAGRETFQSINVANYYRLHLGRAGIKLADVLKKRR